MSVRRLVGGALAFLVAGAVVVPTTTTAASGATPPPDRTSAVEAKRVDSVPTPKVSWFDCSIITKRGSCGTVRLPLDYDQPKGATTEVALFRVRVADPKLKIGTLFVNPGGPGGSGVEMAALAPRFLSPAVLARFDVVGVDPRGINFSDNVRCWKDLGAQGKALTPLSIAFPYTSTETTKYIAAATAFGQACTARKQPLAASMSTAEVARDMDVLRRSVGDSKLTYLGFSYGTYLGQVYANMFPDRVRAVAIDGVLDPVAWAGTAGATWRPQTQRLKSGEGAYGALLKILDRCKAAGPDYCVLASMGDPRTLYAKAIAGLKATPLVVKDPDTGEVLFKLDYATFTGMLLNELYDPEGSMFVDFEIASTIEMLADPTGGNPASAKGITTLRKRLAAQQVGSSALRGALARAGARAGWGFPYDNSPEAFQTVTCTDSRNPSSARLWPTFVKGTERAASGFGALWSWSSAPCASDSWKVKDEDSYRGPFTKRTAKPVLVVGNYWDPATNYASAVKVASLLPNSRLLSSDSYGHTAYGTSDCVTDSVDRYLLTGAVPAFGKKCTGDAQPFTEPLDGGFSPNARSRTAAPQRTLPPVVAPFAGAVARH